MFSKMQIILRITAIIGLAEYLIMLFFLYVCPGLSPSIEALVDTFLLITIASPLIYLTVINPYIQANNELITRINRLVLLDDLTQLGNRRALVDYLIRFLSNNARHKLYGAVLFLDLDKFKSVNDQFGHDAGDAVLVETSKRLANAVRKENIVCRVGGDEFIVLLGGLDHDENAAHAKALNVAHRIDHAMITPIQFGQHSLQISISIGLRMVTPEHQSVEDILSDADAAMYDAKRSLDEHISIFGEVK